VKFLKEFLDAIWEVFKLPFSLIGIGFARLYRLGWRKLTMLSVAAFILTFIVLGTFLEISSHHSFCDNCHIMVPYIEAWETSSHSDVSCMKCHAGTDLKGYFETKFTAVSMLANYFTGIYKRSRPWAEIDDKNCLQQGCHETRVLEGLIEYTEGVAFDHGPHLNETRRGRKLRCTSCHSQIVQGEHISVTSSTCFLCHFKNVDDLGREKLSECSTCHHMEQLKAESGKDVHDHTYVLDKKIDCNLCHSNMWSGSGLVSRERCGACHSQVEHIDRIDDLEFIHEWHIEKRKVDCSRCHDAIEHAQNPIQEDLGNGCNSCHDYPHDVKALFYNGEGSRIVEEKMPDVMATAGVVCVSCHKSSESYHAEAEISEDACQPCHIQSYFRLVNDWRGGFNSRIEDLDNHLKSKISHPQLEAVRHDLTFLKKAGPWHNPKYAEAILDKADDILHSAKIISSPSERIPAGSRQCTMCHSAIESSDIKIEFSDFSHKDHILERQIDCTQCHHGGDPEERHHGDQLATKASCNECHHQPDMDECTPCHTPSHYSYFGTVPGTEELISPMAESEMACVDCHFSENSFKAPENDFCLDCHEQEMIDDLDFVRGEIINLMKGNNSHEEAVKIIQMDKGRAVHNPDFAKKILK